MESSKMALSCEFEFTQAEWEIGCNQLDTGDPLIPKPYKPVASPT